MERVTNKLQLEQPATGWSRFVGELAQDTVLWLLAWAGFGLFRVSMILSFAEQMQASTGFGELWKAAAAGARFDAMAASYPVLPSFIFTALCIRWDFTQLAQRIRRIIGIIAIISHAIICVVTVEFFREYHDQFNQWIFGLVTDDRRAIALTIWKQYPVGLYVLAWITGGIVVWRYLPSLFRIAERVAGVWLPNFHRAIEVGFVFLAAAMLFWSFRGYGIRRPIKQRDIGATSDAVLNRLVANPYVALRYAINDSRYTKSIDGLATFLQSQSLPQATQLQFPSEHNVKDIDQLCLKKTLAAGFPKPKHIFIIVCESFDGWAMFPEHRHLGVASEFLKLAEKGICIRAFIPSGGATVDAMATLISGLPETGINITYQPTSRKTFPTASAPIFKRLGYRTRWFYGGFPSWQRVDEFCLAQGIDEVVGLPSFKNLPAGAIGTWGAYDEFMFRHILETLPDDVPSFNIILTTSNHPPYDCDVVSRGFPGFGQKPSISRIDGNKEFFNSF